MPDTEMDAQEVSYYKHLLNAESRARLRVPLRVDTAWYAV